MPLFAWTAFDFTRKSRTCRACCPAATHASFRYLVIGTGLCWAIAFVPVALWYQLELYGDGAMFSYAVAVQDVWAFHWHNISGRIVGLSLLPVAGRDGGRLHRQAMGGNPDIRFAVLHRASWQG